MVVSSARSEGLSMPSECLCMDFTRKLERRKRLLEIGGIAGLIIGFAALTVGFLSVGGVI